MDELIAVLIMFIGAGLVCLLLLGLSLWLGPKKRNPVKDESFECGNIPIALMRDRFSVKFYTIAILFVLFDIEIIFLFPWAVVFQKIGVLALVFGMALLAAFYLALASQTAMLGRHLQEMEATRATIVRENAYLREQIARTASAAKLRQRAIAAGYIITDTIVFLPIDPNQIDAEQQQTPP